MVLSARDGWRERAVSRSLAPAREKAVQRSERFIAAATELLRETGNLDFTVSDLVERSGQSLRAFYQHFASKDELLLAVFEEAIRSFVEDLRRSVDAEPDPLGKLQAYITGFATAGRSPDRRVSAALSRFLLSVTADDPAELARVLEPQISLLSEIIEEGVAAGRIRSDIPVPVLTVLVTQTLKSAVEMEMLGSHLTGDTIGPDELYRFCAEGCAGPGGRAAPAHQAPRRLGLRARG